MPKFRPIALVIGILLMILGTTMLVPLSVDIVVGHPNHYVFAGPAAVTFSIGLLMAVANRGPVTGLGVREMALITVGAWSVVALFASLPFMFSTVNLDYTDAFFEAVSGLTTTGSTVLTNLDSLPRDILLWRALLQWLGGIGIIVMGLAILPLLGVGGMQLFRMESSDRSAKALPRARQIAVALGFIYCGFTGLCALAYWLEGMTGFEAITHAMTTLSTGGYSTSDSSIGHFGSRAIEWTAIVFMVLGALPFGLYIWMLVRRRWPVIDEQVKLFISFLVIVILVLALWRWARDGAAPFEALTAVAFNVVSVVTTTGYASTDYNAWSGLSVLTFFLLIFAGGCTGSTAGAIKMFRYYVMLVFLRANVRRLLHPHVVQSLTFAKHRMADEVAGSVIAFVYVYLASVAMLAFMLSAVGLDFITSLSGAATAIGNVGPGLGPVIGPAGTFAPLSDTAKWLLAVGMLLGRLEFFTVLMVVTPRFWQG